MRLLRDYKSNSPNNPKVAIYWDISQYQLLGNDYWETTGDALIVNVHEFLRKKTICKTHTYLSFIDRSLVKNVCEFFKRLGGKDDIIIADVGNHTTQQIMADFDWIHSCAYPNLSLLGQTSFCETQWF